MSLLVGAGEDRRWFGFLSRWSLFAGVVYLGLLLVMIFGVMPASQNSPLPEEYFELGAAIENPAVFRLAIALDVADWLALGGFFVAFAAIFISRAPVRGVLVAACGVGQVLGKPFSTPTSTSSLSSPLTSTPARSCGAPL